MVQLELQFIDGDEDEDRTELHIAQAQYTRWIKAEENLLKQKANIK